MLLSSFVHWVIGTRLRVEFALYANLWLLSLSCLPPLLSGGADYFITYSVFCSCPHSFLVWCGVVEACWPFFLSLTPFWWSGKFLQPLGFSGLFSFQSWHFAWLQNGATFFGACRRQYPWDCLIKKPHALLLRLPLGEKECRSLFWCLQKCRKRKITTLWGRNCYG